MPALLTPPMPRGARFGSLGGQDYETFGNVQTRNSLQARLEIPAMIRALGLTRTPRILEVGCGRGVALPVFLERLEPDRLVGLDIEADLLREAECRVGDRAELIHGDVRALPFDDASFDLVVDFGTCYHIARPERALREIARVLTSGGAFVHETPIAQHLAHPVRSFGRSLPWNSVPTLERVRTRILWSLRQKT